MLLNGESCVLHHAIGDARAGQKQYLDGCGVLRMQGLDANEMVVDFRSDQRFVAGAPFGMAWLEGGAVQA
jgi:hypothetical protein